MDMFIRTMLLSQAMRKTHTKLMQKFHVLVLVKPRVSSTNLFVVKTFILWSMYVTIA